MKSMLKSELIRLLENHRDNDILVEFDNYEIPIKGVYYNSQGDQLRITLDVNQVNVVKMLIHEKGLRVKIGNLPRDE